MRSPFLLSAVLLCVAMYAGCGGGVGGGGERANGGESRSAILASCASSFSFFTVAPMRGDSYVGIDPLGNMSPPAHTFPTGHTYMMLNDRATPAAVYAPGEVTLIRASRSSNLTLRQADYSLTFTPCAEAYGYYHHVTSLTAALLERIGSFDDCQRYSDGRHDYELCETSLTLPLAAGELIGYAGGAVSESAALDFGMRDRRLPPLGYVNPDRLVSTDELYIACPYDYYAPGAIRDELFGKLAVFRTAEPLCGKVAHDLAGTAMGKWFDPASTARSEEDHLALAPSNQNPDVGVISAGSSALGGGDYYFTFAPGERVNAPFSEVTIDGAIYCYDTFAQCESAFCGATAGHLFLSLSPEERLTIERVATGGCPAVEALRFSAAAATFVR